MTAELECHPAADAFPLIVGAEFQALVADIAANGLREPVALYEGKILDGRNRERACRQIGIEPLRKALPGNIDPVAYVVSKNLHRRHLKESQRALIAARLATLKQGQRADYVCNSTDTPIGASAPVTQDGVAKMMNVSRGSIGRARLILERGTKAEVKAVESGVMALSAAVTQIKHRQPASFRAKHRAAAKVGKNVDRHERARVRAHVWEQLRTALENLHSMPRVSDIVAMMADAPRVPAQIDSRIVKATTWLKEFADAWGQRDQAT